MFSVVNQTVALQPVVLNAHGFFGARAGERYFFFAAGGSPAGFAGAAGGLIPQT